MKLRPYTWKLVVLPDKDNFLMAEASTKGPVDQPGRSPPSQGGGRGFKSRPVHQKRKNGA